MSNRKDRSDEKKAYFAIAGVVALSGITIYAIVNYFVKNKRKLPPDPDLILRLINACDTPDIAEAELLIKEWKDNNYSTMKKGRTPLHAICTFGDLALIKKLLDLEICYINAKASDGKTPLHIASEMGHLRAVRYLLSKEAEVNAQLENGSTPLFLAAHNEHIDVIVELLKHNADPNIQTEGDVTVLHYAVEHGFEDLVDVLIKKDTINLNARSNTDEAHMNVTPLYLASELGFKSIVSKLVEAGANMDLSGPWGQTPLIVALSNGHETSAIYLIEHGCDINTRIENGASALHYAVISNCSNAVKMLLERGVDPNVLCILSDIDNISPLHLACEAGNLQYAKLLIQHGAHINTELTENSYPPFISAVNGGNVQIIRLLLDYGADPTFRLKDGFTAIHIALSSMNNPVETLTEVLRCGKLNVNDKIHNAEGELFSAIHMAVDSGNPILVRMLLEEGADINDTASHLRTPLIIACQQRKVEVALELIHSGANVQAATDDGTTPLHVSSSYSFELVQALIEKGADVNTQTLSGDLKGATPLLIACEFGQTEIAKLLIEKGANVNARLHNGQPPLINACKSGSVDIVQMILENNGDPTFVTSGNTSALHVAVMTGNIEIVKLLLGKSDINFQNQEGNTALHIAYGIENNEIISELIKNGADTEIRNVKNQKPMEYKM